MRGIIAVVVVVRAIEVALARKSLGRRLVLPLSEGAGGVVGCTVHLLRRPGAVVVPSGTTVEPRGGGGEEGSHTSPPSKEGKGRTVVRASCLDEFRRLPPK